MDLRVTCWLLERAARRSVVFVACALACSTASAMDVSDFRGVVGYTVVAVTQVSHSFEGCDFDKPIRFDNGWTLTCSSFGYSFAFRPDAAIFAREFSHGGTRYLSIKVLIDDDFYDMRPIRTK